MYQLRHTTMPLRYRDGRDTGECRYRCHGKCKTLRTLPFGHGIKLGIFHSYRTISLTLGNLNWQKWVLIDFVKITYHRPQSSVCFGEIMQFHQRCLGPPVLQNEFVVIGMTHLMLGWTA
jgi:hypothetical protein